MRKNLGIGLGLLLMGGTLWAQQYLVTTVAGGGLPPTAAPASSTALGYTQSVATDAAGSAYFIASNCVFKVDASGVLTRVAGSSTGWGYSGDGGPATNAQLSNPAGVAVDGSGNLYIADTYNSVIRKVAAATGIITTVAGNGTYGFSGDGGQAASAELSEPAAVAVDGSGNIYIADNYQRIRKVAAPTGIITTVAGNGSGGYSGDGGPATSAQLSGPTGVAVDAAGNIYIADYWNQRIRKVTVATGIITTAAGNGTQGYSGDGGPATSAQLNYPWGVSVDAGGDLYISDQYNGRIRKVAATGTITTVAGGGGAYPGDGGLATSASLSSPLGAAMDGSGNLYIADDGNCRIRRVAAATGIITTAAGNGGNFSGDGGPATSAQLWMPFGMAVDGSGNLYIPDLYNRRVRKVAAATGIITTVAGNGSYGYSGDGGPATSAQLSAVYSVAVDGAGNLYIGDNDNQRIRKVAAATGIITTVAGYGTQGYWGDQGPATSALLSDPDGVAVDASGNLYIAEWGNSVIRKVTAATGIITTVAGTGTSGYWGDGGPATSAMLNNPEQVAVDGSGNIYIADSGNCRVRKVAAATGIITTVAGNGTCGYSGDGGPAISAQIYSAWGVAVDAAGSLYIVDGNQTVRKVAANGTITTVAGTGYWGYRGDGGPASSALFNSLRRVAVDAAGNVYLADSNNNAIRMLAPMATHALLSVASTHSADPFQGETAATYSVVVSNTAGAGPTVGTVTATEIVPTSLTLVSMSGVGWNCSGATCTRSDALSAGSSYPAIAVTVNVAVNAPVQVVNQVTVSGGGAGPASASDLTTVSAAAASCTYAVSPTVLNATASGGILTATIQTSAGCGWSVQNLPGWIAIFGSAQGTGSSTVTLAVAANSGPARSAQISIAGVAVTVNQASTPIVVSSNAVVNAANYTAPVAPGSIAAVFGSFPLAAPIPVTSFPIPTNLGGLSLQFGGTDLAPLFYANSGQVNAQIPWELAGQSQTNITASMSGQSSAAQTVSLATYAPGIFAVNGQGTGPGAILDLNYHLISAANPTTAGAYIQIYCTGLGPVSNQPATGAPSPSNPLASTPTWPTVTIGGVSATAQFSGLTPGDVGLYQVNARVPAGAPKGNAVPLAISIGGATSNTVTIAVQ
ncbi:MAG: hypothetical protein ACLQGV_02765 [Bryobacteraceae bacterium]